MALSKKLHDELARIAAAHRMGILLPARVVEAARASSSPLHSHFEWDNDKAGGLYRLQQARQLIALDFEQIKPDANKARTIDVRAWTAPKSNRGKDGGYVQTITLLKSKSGRALLIADARGDMQCFQRKFQILSELSNVFKAMTVADRKLAKVA